MNNSYEQKYHKYKEKYLSLKAKLRGGSNEIAPATGSDIRRFEETVINQAENNRKHVEKVIKELKENSSWARVVEIRQLEEVVIEKFQSNDEHLKLLGDRIEKFEKKILDTVTRLMDQLDEKDEKFIDYVEEQINELKGPVEKGSAEADDRK